MEYNYLGNTGLKVSKLCLGTMTFGDILPLPENGTDEATSVKIMDRFVELGGNFIDTAEIYNKGGSEEVIGRWLERRERENIVMATKVRFSLNFNETDTITMDNAVGLTRRHITAAIDKSLQRLHTDYIDLYQTHLWDEATPIEETLRTLDDLVRCGKVRYVGASNLTGWQMQKVVDVGKVLGLNPFVTLQQQYSLLSRWSEIETFPVCKMEGLGVLPWSPLKGGLLTGRYKKNVTPTDGRMAYVARDESRKSEIAPSFLDLPAVTWDIVETAEKIAKAKGKSTAQVALRWLLQKDVVSSVVIGATKIQHVDDNVGAAVGGWTLTPEEMQQLDDVSLPELQYPHNMNLDLNKDRRNAFQHVLNIK